MKDPQKTHIHIIDEIIQKRKFHHLFQPIHNLKNWKVFGYEALLRCRFFSNPELLFRYAIEENRLYDLDTCSIYHALASINVKHKKLFVNVYPSTIIHPSFPGFVERLKDVPYSEENVVFEINEAEKIHDILDLFRRRIWFLKEKGYAIALDDFGKGESSLRAVIELEPDYVKIDRYFSINLSRSKHKQIVIQMLLSLSKEKDMKLILEGIEKPADLATAKALGVHFGQGFLLGKPLPLSEIHPNEGD